MVILIKKEIYYIWGLMVAISLLAGCQQKPALTGFDQVAWRQDTRSCNNIRPSLVPALTKVTPDMIGLRHTTVIDILGKPEGNSLEKSGQRVYYYYLAPGLQCKNNSNEAKKIFLRFDALDRVNKIIFEE